MRKHTCYKTVFMVVAFRGQRMGRNYAQLLAWTGIAGIAWVAGAFVPGDGRLLLWVIALVLDYGAPIHGFVLPGVGRTPMGDWTLAGGHAGHAHPGARHRFAALPRRPRTAAAC